MDIITLSHGSGGRATNRLIKDLFYKYFTNEYLVQENDSTVLPKVNGKIAVTTDSFVIAPLFFKGGDIGKLSICGTVNDLAMSGAKPLYITAGFIIEEGLLISDLEKIVISMAETAKEANVKIIAGDTKVVEKGSGDGIFINTTGIGVIEDADLYIGGGKASAGDKIIISGTIGDHGTAIMNMRKDLDFDVDVESDCGLLNGLIDSILKISKRVKVLRDPTRGGVATTLNEIAQHSLVSMAIDEEKLPIKEEVSSMCNILGLDPLFIANEGKLLVIAGKEDSERILNTMKNHPIGKDAAIIGEVIDDGKNKVYLITEIGGKRIINMPEGELLVRIC